MVQKAVKIYWYLEDYLFFTEIEIAQISATGGKNPM